jgi:integrase
MARPRNDTPNYKLVQRGATWYVRWWQDGQWQRVSTGQTERRKATVFLAQFTAGRGTPTAPDAPTIAMILDGYLADRKPVVRAYDTLGVTAKALRRHLGDLQPDHLTKERIRFYGQRRRAEGHQVGPADARRKKPTSDGTLIRELVTLRAALKWAKAAKWIDGDLPHIQTPSAPPPRDRWLTRDEADRLLDSARALHVQTFLSLCVYTAARSGALRELTWDRVDLTTGRIDLGAVAGGKGRAVIPIADALRPYLAQAREAATCRYVIEHGGKPVASLKTGTRAAARRAGLSGVTPHVLRHTAATWMVQAGVPIEQVARMLGHRDPRVTWTTYAKHSPDYLQDAVKALSG